MLDAVGGGGFHPEMRRARHGDISGLRLASDLGTSRAQCQDLAGAAELQIRSRRATGSESAGLTSPVIPGRAQARTRNLEIPGSIPELGFTRVRQTGCPSRQQPTWLRIAPE